MTQRELPRRGVSEPTTMDIPVVSASTGTWTTGLSDFIDADHFAALKAMSGLTVDPEIERHQMRDRLDQNQE